MVFKSVQQLNVVKCRNYLKNCKESSFQLCTGIRSSFSNKISSSSKTKISLHLNVQSKYIYTIFSGVKLKSLVIEIFLVGQNLPMFYQIYGQNMAISSKYEIWSKLDKFRPSPQSLYALLATSGAVEFLCLTVQEKPGSLAALLLP